MIRTPWSCVLAGATLLALAGLPGNSVAATLCATTSFQLQGALSFAETNGESDVVRIATGVYTVPAAGSFEHDPVAIVGGDAFDIEISGGWTPFAGNPCGQQLASTDAFQTLLDGDDQFRVLNVRARSGADVRIQRLAFRAGNATSGSGGGLRVAPQAPHAAVVSIERCVFLLNSAVFGSALELLGGGTARVRNSLFVINDGQHAVQIINNEVGVYFTNNTVIDNTSSSDSGGLYVQLNASAEAFVANNILWDNDGFDVGVVGSLNTFRNNDYQDRSGPLGTTELGNLSVAPVFASGILNYTPAEGSPLVDGGVNAPGFVPVPPPFDQNWSMGTNDVYGESRVRGVRVDIGAAEAPGPLLVDGFESP